MKISQRKTDGGRIQASHLQHCCCKWYVIIIIIIYCHCTSNWRQILRLPARSWHGWSSIFRENLCLRWKWIFLLTRTSYSSISFGHDRSAMSSLLVGWWKLVDGLLESNVKKAWYGQKLEICWRHLSDCDAVVTMCYLVGATSTCERSSQFCRVVVWDSLCDSEVLCVGALCRLILKPQYELTFRFGVS